MKFRISATVDKKTLHILKDLVRDGTFRNKSHAIEKALEFLDKHAKKKKNED
tara:strand:- start:3998 stop:4153 length:156 start_codon:yes stop_codon:yes gene_type:complete